MWAHIPEKYINLIYYLAPLRSLKNLKIGVCFFNWCYTKIPVDRCMQPYTYTVLLKAL